MSSSSSASSATTICGCAATLALRTAQGRRAAWPPLFSDELGNGQERYSNGLFTVKLGPFFDTGSIADASDLFGSQRWLFDTGAQCKVRVLGSITVVLIYGRDLRGGRNVFYGTVVR